MPSNLEPLTPAVLAELERLLAEATPPPWMYRQPEAVSHTPKGERENWPFHIDVQGTPGRTNWGILLAKVWGHTTKPPEANAALIVAAVNALPALLAELSARLEREGRLEEACKLALTLPTLAIKSETVSSSHSHGETKADQYAEKLRAAIDQIKAALAEGRVGG